MEKNFLNIYVPGCAWDVYQLGLYQEKAEALERMNITFEEESNARILSLLDKAKENFMNVEEPKEEQSIPSESLEFCLSTAKGPLKKILMKQYGDYLKKK